VDQDKVAGDVDLIVFCLASFAGEGIQKKYITLDI